VADQLASLADLAALLQQDVGDLNAASATLALEIGTALVQAVTGQRLVQVVNDVVTIDLDPWGTGHYLSLPERPVTAVTAVLIGDTDTTDYTPQLSYARLWRSSGWRSALTSEPWQPSQVTVAYTHGYALSDQRLQLARTAALQLALLAYDNPGGATREQIDDYAVAYEAASARLEASPFLVAALRRQYSRRPVSVQLIRG
jgi:hypothetical protein